MKPLLSRLWIAIGLSLWFCTGCGSPTEINRTYGSHKYPDKNSSINGLGIFERLCNQAGIRWFSATRLSPRLEKADCILLVGDTFQPPAKEARDWLEQWLARRPGAIIYFGRDFEADIYYRQKTLAGLPADKLDRARLELASREAELDEKLVTSVEEDAFCRWFVLRPSSTHRTVSEFEGPWREGMDTTQAHWPVRFEIDPALAEDAINKPAWKPAPTMVPTFPFNARSRQGKRQDKSLIFQSIWRPTDINDDKTWSDEWERAPDPEVLLQGADEIALVTRLTSYRYPESQIIALINGAPLLNGSIVEPHFRSVARRLIEQVSPAKRMAILPYSENGIQVSLIPEEEDEVAGLTVLKTWPMNLIVAHLALLGVIFCLALFPILGRPQPLAQESVSDFGQHAEALGQLLNRTHDMKFALRVLSDYIRVVRGEALPSWLQSSDPTGLPSQTPAANTDAADTDAADTDAVHQRSL